MIRKSIHAGTFYPRFTEQVEKMFEIWERDFNTISMEKVVRTLGLVVPHAGYMYSGHCTAMGFSSILGEKVDSFIILHPSHHGSHFDFSVSPYLEYETPLGSLELDRELYDTISFYANQQVALQYHQEEHSLEIQLPFIRRYFPTARICPVMIGNQIPTVARRLGDILYDVLSRSKQKVMVLVSTDLSHYHSAHKAEEMDSLVARHFKDLDPEGLWSDHEEGALEACGIGGIMALLYLAGKYTSKTAKIVNYTHSGKVAGNNSQVVGYLAARIAI